MPTTIESLELELVSNSSSATSSIDSLAATLSKIKAAVKGGLGLASVNNQLRNLNTTLQEMDGNSIDKIDRLSNSLNKLKNISSLKISSSIANQLNNIGSAASALNSSDLSGIERLSNALQPLNALGNMSGLRSAFNALNKLPALSQTLNNINWNDFTSRIQQLSNALSPLANQLNIISSSFNRLPANMRNVVSTTNRITSSNNTTKRSYINLWAKAKIYYSIMERGIDYIAQWVTQSNAYIENLNLFNASMGEYAQKAQEYAERVGDLMGIDPGEWMRNQGVFNTIIKGFGVASDRAYTMSKNLTQLGYDISSFYNISFEDAMTKLQSGISGELEPLRRLGYDLSVARLQQEAYTLGIKKKITAMTQAEKSELRYYAIMTQVKTAQGDMARTLEAPANQLRILRAQITQLSRALGNIFIPMITTVLPYVIAFTKVLRGMAEGIANLAGFELQKVDYSGLQNATSSITDNLSEATDAAKKLKRNIMGFDELNILDKDDDTTVSDELGGSLGFELPEYDFIDKAISTKVDDILKTITNIVDKVKEWLGLNDEINNWGDFFHTRLGHILSTVGAIALGLAAWKISQKVLNAIAFMQGLSGKGLTIPLMFKVGLSMLTSGIALEVAGLADAIKNSLDPENFAQIVAGDLLTIGGAALLGGAIANWIGKAFAGSVVAKALSAAATNLGLGSIGAAGAAIAASVAAIIVGIPGYLVGIYDAIKNGLNWLNGILITGSATLAGAGIGALIGALGGPIGAGIGALVGLVIGMITDLGIWLYQNWDEVTEWFSKNFETVSKFFSDTVPNWWNGTIIPFFSNSLELIKNSFIEKWTIVIEFMKQIPSKIGEIINSIGQWFSELPGKLGYALGYALGSVVGWVTDIYNTLKTQIPQIIENVRTWFSELPSKIYDALSSAVNKIGEWCTNVYNTCKEKITKIASDIKTWFLEVPAKIYDALSSAINKIGEWATAMINKVKETVPKIIDSIVDFFKSIPEKIKSLGIDIWNGLVTGLKSAWNSVVNAMKNFINSFVQGFKDALGIHSPSTVFQNIGLNVIAGLKNGLSNIGSVFTNIFSTIRNAISNFGTNMFRWGSEMMNNLVKGINGGLTTLKNKVVQAANTIRSYLHFTQPDIGPLSDFNTWMPDMMSQLAEGIAKDEYKVKRQMDSLAESMSLETSIQNTASYNNTPTVNNDANMASVVSQAVMAALSAQNNGEDSGTPIIINLGNEQIASFLVKQNKRAALISGGKA